MKTVNDHLERGIEEFEKAHEKAPMGTRMMIGDLLEEANELADRVNNIIEDSDGSNENN